MPTIEREGYVTTSENGVIRTLVKRNQVGRDLEEFKADILSFASAPNSKFLGIINTGEAWALTPEAAKIYVEIGKMPMWTKIAIVASNLRARSVAKILASAVHASHVKVFSEEGLANKWLFEGK
jgi:hypothetical protein